MALELISDDWRLARQLLGVLSRMDLVTKCLGGERYSTLSWCLPLMSSLAAYCKEDVEDERLIVTSLKAPSTKAWKSTSCYPIQQQPIILPRQQLWIPVSDILVFSEENRVAMETCSCKQFQQDAATFPKKIAKTPQPQSENLSACCSMIFLDQRKLKTMVLILLRLKSALTSQRKSSNVWWTHWHGGRSMLISFPAWEI